MTNLFAQDLVLSSAMSSGRMECAVALSPIFQIRHNICASKRLGYLSDQDSSAKLTADSSVIEPKIVEAEKVLNSLIRSVQNLNLQSSAY